MLPSQPTRIAIAGGAVSLWVRAAWLATPLLPASSSPAPTQATTIAAVTSGPAIAILNSVPGVSESFSRRAKPPNIHRVMPETPMSVPSRHEGVPQLVQQDRGEEERGAGDREQVWLAVARGRVKHVR